MALTVFADRVEAGRLLGEELRGRGLGGPGGIVLGIPRGGVATAAEVARVLAVPVAPPQTAERLAHAYEDVIALATPPAFFAVGEFYVDFRQVSDDEVREVLSAE